MADTVFVDYQPPAVNAAWLNDVNSHVYHGRSLDGITVANVKDPTYGAVGDGITDDTAAIQACITANVKVFFPPGTYLISQKLIMRTDSVLTGVGNGSRIKGNHAGVLLEFPINNTRCVVQDISLSGTACTGIAVATTAGPLQGYLYSALIERVQFWYELDYGINAQLLLCHITNSNFGHFGNGTVNTTNGFVGLKAYAYYQPVNANRLSHTGFENCGGGTNKVALWLYGTTGFEIHNCDFEGCGGRVAFIDQGGLTEFKNCWFERNGGSAPNTPNTLTSLFLIDGHYDSVKFIKCQFGGGITNGTNSVIEWVGATSAGVHVEDCTFALENNQYSIYDNTAANYGFDGAGRIKWENNYVSGGNASNPLITTANKGVQGTPRAWAVVNTASSGSIVASSDPKATIAKNSTGNVTITWSSPYCTNANYGCVTASGQLGTVWVATSSTTTTTVQARTNAGVAQEDIIHVTVFGK